MCSSNSESLELKKRNAYGKQYIGLDEFIIHNLFISLTLIYVYEIVLSQYRYGKKNRHSKLILIQENVINNLEINCPVNPLEQCKRILKNSNNRPK